MSLRTWTLFTTAAAATLLAGAAFADDQAAAPAASPPATVDSWVSSIKFSGHIEAGVMVNPDDPSNDVNFGHVFTGRSNQFTLNQIALTAERDPDPKSKTVDFGFKLQGMYGSDSQITHLIGLGDHSSTSRNAFDLVEANILAHLPVLTPGGIDVKVGIFSTPIGQEVIDPTGDFFYSKSYIFNFGIPLKHTGILTTTHVNSLLDIYLGYTTGVNTFLGSDGGYNDGQFHFLGGFGLNFSKVTILALTHIGPENPAGSLPPPINIHDQYRYLNDILVTWKINDKLTSVTEFNYIKDDGFNAAGGGVAEYLTYPLSSVVTGGLRVEVWRDAQGFFVAGFPHNLDFINLEMGLPNSAYGAGPVTYGAITLGLNIKPKKMPKQIDGLMLRPEIRYDRALSSGEPFGAIPGTSKNQFTFGIDLVVPFTL
jgi:hypothetical protein